MHAHLPRIAVMNERLPCSHRRPNHPRSRRDRFDERMQGPFLTGKMLVVVVDKPQRLLAIYVVVSSHGG